MPKAKRCGKCSERKGLWFWLLDTLLEILKQVVVAIVIRMLFWGLFRDAN